MVRQPVLLNKQLTEKARLRATAGNLELSVSALPKATLTLEIDQTLPEVHDFVWIYTERGNAGLFRVVSSNFNYGQSVTVQLLGAADTLSDDVYNETATETVTKTAAQWIPLILAKQTTQRWQMGDCELACDVGIKPNYQNLWDLLETIRETRPGYFWIYDFTTSPWTISLKHMPDEVVSEFRITRNVESAQVAISDQDLFNQLVFTITDDSEHSAPTVYNDTASQAKYGIRTRCTDIKTDEIPLGLTAQQYALQILSEHANPVSSITINGFDLHKLTGDDFDKITLGSLCRAVLPDYGSPLEERVVVIKWPDIFGTEDKITVNLSTEIPGITGSLASAKQLASAVKTASRGGGGGGGKAGKDRPINLVLTETIEAVEGVGIDQIWQSGLVISSAQEGVRIFSLYNGLQSLDAELKVTKTAITQEVTRAEAQEGILSGRIDVQAGQIGLVVKQTQGGNVIDSAAIMLALQNDQSSIKLRADQISLDGQTVASLLSTESIDCQGLHTGELSVEAANGFTYQTTAVKWGEIQKDGVFEAYYLGDGTTVNFDRAAAKAEGAAAVGLALDTAAHKVMVTPTSPTKYVIIGVQVGSLVYSESAHNYTVIANAKIGDGVMATEYGQSGTEAWDSVTVSGSWSRGDSGNSNSYVATAANGKKATANMRLEATNTWDNGSRYVYLYDAISSGGTKRAHVTVSIPSPSSWTKNGDTITVTIAGKTFSHTF